eukprot:g2795.t1
MGVSRLPQKIKEIYEQKIKLLEDGCKVETELHIKLSTSDKEPTLLKGKSNLQHDSKQGYYGYTKDYLMQVLNEIDCDGQNPSYVRGMALYSMSAIANLGRLATGAYAYPSADGWEEHTEDDVLVRNLSWNWTKSNVKEVLKITLNSINVNRQRRRASLHIQTAWSTITTDAIRNPDSSLPETHYFLLRESNVMGKDVTMLNARFSYRPYFRRRQYVDFEPLSIESLRDTPTNSWAPNDQSFILEFTAEFLSFEEACSANELNIPETSGAWSQSIPQFQDVDWVPAINQTILNPQEFETCVYIDNEATSTQCWIFRLLNTKTIVVSFRGTQIDHVRDIAMDGSRNLAFARQEFTFGDDDPCELDFDRTVESDAIAVSMGYWNAYISIRSTLLEIVYQMSENWSEDWSIIVNGHSLGAALATICGFEYINRTANGTGPRISALTFAPVRTGTQAFVDRYNRQIPDSVRVINEEDYLGGEFLEDIYEHVSFELHYANNAQRTVTLPDSSRREVDICRDVMSKISQRDPSATLPEEETSLLPTAIEHHDLGQYLYSTMVVIHNLGEDEVSAEPDQMVEIKDSDHDTLV